MIRHISSKHIFRKPLSGNKSAENNNLHSLSPIKLCCNRDQIGFEMFSLCYGLLFPPGTYVMLHQTFYGCPKIFCNENNV